jgi:hypothetical protein
MRSLLFIIVFQAIAIQLFSQEKELKKCPFQASLIYPIGTNGIDNINCANQFSLNLFYGLGGAVDGFEAGAFVNMVTGYVHGAQVAGFANASGELNGAQLAGFANLNAGSAQGLQGAGFANVNAGDGNYAQLAGFANVGGSGKIFQGAGFANVGDSIFGAQLAGFGNAADEIEGLQGAGFGNAADDVVGAQVAGFGNVADDVDGAQIAGFMNIADNVKGVQIAGFINICDSIDGIPIAFINIVGTNGYQKIEVWNSEMFTIGGTFKLGVPKFYTSFNIGYHFTNQYEIGTGFGIGTNFQMKEKTTLAVELTNWNLFDDRLFESNSFTDLSQFKVMFNYNVNERVGIFGGPSINCSLFRFKGNCK